VHVITTTTLQLMCTLSTNDDSETTIVVYSSSQQYNCQTKSSQAKVKSYQLTLVLQLILKFEITLSLRNGLAPACQSYKLKLS